ncbi:MAG: RsmB/NOP family class I SAM-dependent RNA methyltransferase [Deltaproteobacteria bacterium]|nr:RsmB/NOP family class I SAM-dependent RNA methyltransferase [Deltaproteobacteria bacterium]
MVSAGNERAVLEAALQDILAGAATDDTVARVLRALSLDRAGRRRVATTLFRASVLRLRLAWLARSERPADLLDALAAEPSAHPAWPADPLERVVVERSCPRWLVERLAASLGLPGADAFLAASNAPGPKTLRANALLTTRDELARQLLEEGIETTPGALSPWSLHVVEGDDDDAPRANLKGSRAWRDGLFELQDESSQLCALACAARPGEVVVDLCAGRGGKALALAACMASTAERGELWLHDVDERALADAEARLRRAGVSFARRGLPPQGAAELVLVDAPCSSLGPLRRSPDLRYRLRPEELEALPTRQRQLLDQGATLLRPGGRVVYATCTVLREENEAVVAASGLKLESERTLRPDVEGCDGFFIACMGRAPSATNPLRSSGLGH